MYLLHGVARLGALHGVHAIRHHLIGSLHVGSGGRRVGVVCAHATPTWSEWGLATRAESAMLCKTRSSRRRRGVDRDGGLDKASAQAMHARLGWHTIQWRAHKERAAFSRDMLVLLQAGKVGGKLQRRACENSGRFTNASLCACVKRGIDVVKETETVRAGSL